MNRKNKNINDNKSLKKKSKSFKIIVGILIVLLIILVASVTAVYKFYSQTNKVTIKDAVPGVGEKNLNNAYAYGGADLLVKTFNYNFGLDITDYVKVDFKTFVKVIDKIGGVDIDIKQDELKVTNGIADGLYRAFKRSSQPIKAGDNTLDGVQVLAYSRNRTVGSDFARTNRQRIVLQAVLDKISKCGYIEGLKYANDILPDVTTTLNIGEVSDIGQWVILNKINTFESTYFPKSDEVKHIVTDEYHMVMDKEKLKQEVQAYIYEQSVPLDCQAPSEVISK